MRKKILLFVLLGLFAPITFSQTVSISGNIIDQDNIPLSGVTITFSNNGGTATTDVNGDYSHDVSNGYYGTATPSLDGYSFDPVFREYSNLTGNATNQDYVGNQGAVTISGIITDDDGNGVQGVVITFDNGGGTTETNSNGYYSKSVGYGYTGTATPDKVGYTFTPSSRSYSNVTSNKENEDYTGSLITVNISGNIVDWDNAPLEGVTITFSNNGGLATTDVNGDYTHDVSYGYSGVALPSKEGYSFDPTYREYSNLTGNATNQDYIGNDMTAINENPVCLANLSVYPNPASEYLYFEIKFVTIPDNVEILIYNTSGVLIKKLSDTPSIDCVKLLWDTRRSANNKAISGVYYYKVFVNGINTKSGKVILK